MGKDRIEKGNRVHRWWEDFSKSMNFLNLKGFLIRDVAKGSFDGLKCKRNGLLNE